MTNAAGRRQVTHLANLIRSLQPPEGAIGAATLAGDLHKLQHKHGHALQVVTDQASLKAAADTLANADRHTLILASRPDLRRLRYRARLTKHDKPYPNLPRELDQLRQRADRRATRRFQTRGRGHATILHIAGVLILINRADPTRLRARTTRQGIHRQRHPNQPPATTNAGSRAPEQGGSHARVSRSTVLPAGAARPAGERLA